MSSNCVLGSPSLPNGLCRLTRLTGIPACASVVRVLISAAIDVLFGGAV